MSTFLERICARRAEDVAARRREVPEDELRARIGPRPTARSFHEALAAPGMSVISELKRASPSKGPIHPDARAEDVVRAYREGGAAACSILTEPEFFGGTLDDLVAARAAVDLPLLRKDFVVDEYQLLEARAVGADAALLIVAALPAERLEALLAAAADLGLDALVEVHSRDELRAAADAGARIIGVNNRDLHSLDVDLETTHRLLADRPPGVVVVAESGITGREDVARLEDAGVDAILVGEALMRASSPAAGIAALLGRPAPV